MGFEKRIYQSLPNTNHTIQKIHTLTETTIQLTHADMTSAQDPVFGVVTIPSVHTMKPAVSELVQTIPVKQLDTSVWEHCQRAGITHLITVDPSDLGQLDLVPILESLMKVSRSEPNALVFGVPDGTVSPKPTTMKQRIVRWRTDRWFRLITACPVKNVWSQYRVYPVHLLSDVASDQHGAAWMFDIMVRAAWGRLPLAEMPLPIPKPLPFGSISRLRLSLFLRWLIILPVRPRVLLQED